VEDVKKAMWLRGRIGELGIKQGCVAVHCKVTKITQEKGVELCFHKLITLFQNNLYFIPFEKVIVQNEELF